LREFCLERDLPYEQCGKIVVAIEDRELPRLERLWERGVANGVPGLQRLDAAALRAIEPHAGGIAALHSPQTAITDFHRVAKALADDLCERGGTVRTGVTVRRVEKSSTASCVELADGSILRADHTVVCAGLHADRIARDSREPAEPRIIPFRGEYWQLREHRRDLVKGLIYPVPDPSLPFLGIHLTRKIDGSVWIGPNAILALGREGYGRMTFRPADVRDTLSWPGTPKLFLRHWRAGVREIAWSVSKAAFIREARRYVPELRSSDAVRARAGVRAQAVDRDGSLVDDFRFGGDHRVVWVRNAPSPGATSSLAIAEEIVERLTITRGGRPVRP
jgi:L-2-hydroxyglutarate oxidase LhgO